MGVTCSQRRPSPFKATFTPAIRAVGNQIPAVALGGKVQPSAPFTEDRSPTAARIYGCLALPVITCGNRCRRTVFVRPAAITAGNRWL